MSLTCNVISLTMADTKSSVLYWRYKAFDQSLRTHTGLLRARNFAMLSLLLRQRGLQVIEAQTLDKSQFLSELTLMDRFYNTSESEVNYQCNLKWYHKLLARFARLFGVK